MFFEINLNNLVFYAHHGVMEEERRLGNEFHVDLSVLLPSGKDLELDKIENTISYVDLYSIVKEEMNLPRNLLEKVALNISERIKSQYPQIQGGKIRIEKVRPPIEGMIGTASITLTF